jgi:short-subunit dehydrogenase
MPTDRLAWRGSDLIVVARNEARREALAARVTTETGHSATPLRAGLSDRADLAMVERVLRDDQAIIMLITALTAWPYAAAPAFVARGAGTTSPLSR